MTAVTSLAEARAHRRHPAGKALARRALATLARGVADQPLPLDGLPDPQQPAPGPSDVKTTILGRDGYTCRACSGGADINDEHTTFGGRLVSLSDRLGGETPELALVVMCNQCADRAESIKQRKTGNRGPSRHEDGWPDADLYMRKLLRLLYIENCALAGLAPIKWEVITR